MNENGKKKREWVKTAAIVFLSVMLVLTFFSNTIMNCANKTDFFALRFDNLSD